MWKFQKKNRLRIIQQTNENNIFDLTEFYSKNNIENKIFSFDKNIFDSIQQADLCITRAGASTLAEFSIMSIPFIAVPLPTAMIRLSKKLNDEKSLKSKMLLQIHDELIFEVKKSEIKKMMKIIKDEMISVANSDYHSFSIPLTVDINSGDNWGMLH